MEWRNDKHYPDPTAGLALFNVAKDEKKPFVFISSPYRGDIETNIRRAKRYMYFAITEDVVPFAPHLLYPMVLDDKDKHERNKGLALGLAWLNKCDELWVFGRHITYGMQKEIEKALDLKILVRYFTKECGEASV